MSAEEAQSISHFAGALDFEASTLVHAPGSQATRQAPVPHTIGPRHELALQPTSHELAVEQSIPPTAAHVNGPQRTLHGPAPQRSSPSQA
jgi:hypothetical protein